MLENREEASKMSGGGFSLRKEERVCEWRLPEDEEFCFKIKSHIVIPK